MNNLQIFKNEEFGEVRTIEINNEPWLVGKDVTNILGYSNSRDALIKRVDAEDKVVAKCDTLGGSQELTVINESGLYSLILSSKLPTAKRFKHWVTSDILPAIRKHGAYMTPDKIEEILLNPDTIIGLAQELKDERALRSKLQDKVETDKPKVIFADAVSVAHTTILIGDLAKLLKQNGVSIGAKRLFQWLRENGYLIKRQGTDWNMPTQKAMEMGLFKVKETSITHGDGHTTISKTTKVTGKGQQYFISKFLS
jgi:anti-repressor protein